MNKKCTLFCDIDGTIFEYRKFGTYFTTKPNIIKNIKEKINQAYLNQHCVVLTTARPEELREETIKELQENDIKYHQLIMGIERGTRILINDKEDENVDRAYGINVKRNQGFSEEDIFLLNKILLL